MNKTLGADTMSAIRRLYAPDFPSEYTKERECRRCGGTFLVWLKSPHRYCPDCSYRRQLEVESRVAESADSVYARVVRNQLRYWLAEAERLGLTPETWQ